MAEPLTDEDLALLAKVRNGKVKPVRGREAEVAKALNLRQPCLVATGALGDDVVAMITGDGRTALEAHGAEGAAP